MRTITFATAAAIVTVLLLPGSIQATLAAAAPRANGAGQVPSNGSYYALVIGNDNYKYAPHLKTAEDDAKQVAMVLQNKYGFKIRLLLNSTREEILSAINQYRRELDANASLLIYYAGHGYNDTQVDKAYWLPVDSRLDDNANWISADDVTVNGKGIPARHVLIISDSCYSGTMTRGLEVSLSTPNERTKYLEKMLSGKSRTLMASGGNEPVADGGGGNHSIFANAFLQGLERIDQSEFTADELFRGYIQESVAGRASQTPEYNPLRNSGHESGDFVFVRTGAAPAKPETAAATSSPGDKGVLRSTAAASTPAPSADSAAFELAYWESIKHSRHPQDFRDYLKKYPQGQFADLARPRAELLTRWMVQPGFRIGVQREQEDRYYPMHVEGRDQDGVLQYRAAFRAFPGSMFRFFVRVGMTQEEYDNMNQDLTSKGFARESYQTFIDHDKVTRIQAVWTKRPLAGTGTKAAAEPAPKQ